MKVLIATNELQGTARGDYAWTVEGELVTPVAEECGSSRRCGCNRGFPGLASAYATTTAMVVDRPGISLADLRNAVEDYLVRGGWLDLLTDEHDEHDDQFAAQLESLVDEHVDTIRMVCACYDVGTVIERDGPRIANRLLDTAA